MAQIRGVVKNGSFFVGTEVADSFESIPVAREDTVPWYPEHALAAWHYFIPVVIAHAQNRVVTTRATDRGW